MKNLYLLIIVFLSFIFSQEVTLTFDCPNEVVAGSEGNEFVIMMESNIDIAAIELFLGLENTYFEINQISNGDFNNGFTTSYIFENGEYRIFTFSLGIGLIMQPGVGSLFILEFIAPENINEFTINFSDIIIANSFGESVEDINYSDTCTISVVEPPEDVYLGIGDIDLENQTIEFIMNNTVDVAGIQFSLTGLTVGNVLYDLGGSAVDNGFWSSTNGSTIIISLLGSGGIIPPSNGPLMYFPIETIDSTEVCIVNPIMTNGMGNVLNLEVSDCVSTHQDCTVPGDVNNDSEVNVLDILQTVDCILGHCDENNWFECGIESADLNQDGQISVIDIIFMVNIILGEE